MKILYHHRIRSKDGQYVHLEEMVHALRAAGHEIILCGPKAVETEAFGAESGLVDWLKRSIPQWLYELMELTYSLFAYWRLCAAIKRHQPNCIYERYNLFAPAGIWAKRRFKLPFLLEVNAPLFEERLQNDGLALTRLARWSQHYCWRHADFALPVTGVLADYLYAAGVARSRVHVIPNAINDQRFPRDADPQQAKQRLGLSGQRVLGFVGFVRAWHGLDKVLDLLIEPGFESTCMLVVGDGPAITDLRAQAARLQLTERLYITGVVGREQVAAYIAAFDLALQPSVVAYASPLKLYEYLAMGKAIIAPDTANIKEVLQHDVNAWLFAADDKQSFAAAVRHVALDDSLQERLAKQAYLTLEMRGISWENNATQVVDLFRQLGVDCSPSLNPSTSQ